MNFEKTTKVVSHDGCPDGIASAMIVKDAIPSAEIVFMQYNTEAHKALEPQEGVLFVDFSPFVGNDMGLLVAWAESGSLILDHHKTARPIVEAFGEHGIFGDELANPGVCGAVLAYNHVWKPVKNHESELIERFARLAGVRDTWLKSSPEWNTACEQASTLQFIPQEKWLEKPIYEHLYTWQIKYGFLGKLLIEKHQASVKKAIDGAFKWVSPKGTRVVLFQGVHLTSDAAEMLGNEADLIIGYTSFCENGELQTVFSTRTQGDFDCSSFCKLNGGGGHTKAAGFKLNADFNSHPVGLAMRILNAYEANSI